MPVLYSVSARRLPILRTTQAHRACVVNNKIWTTCTRTPLIHVGCRNLSIQRLNAGAEWQGIQVRRGVRPDAPGVLTSYIALLGPDSPKPRV